MKNFLATLGTALLAVRSVAAIELDLTSPDSIKSAARKAADGMMSFYDGNQTGKVPGDLPDPYYWWEAGAMMGALIDYWYYTGDTSYNPTVEEAMLFQVGPDDNYMPPNQSKSLGNDDQGFWGIAAMSAAEAKFPNPPDDEPQWLALAQAVFNSQAVRWNTESCGGGLKWQIFSFNDGYTYKNTISNGCFFNLASRLGMYTGNKTYLEWATRSWEWQVAIGLIDDETWQVFDGSNDMQNCTKVNHMQWSYNTGVLLYGAATMWNQTENDERAQWEARINGLLEGVNVFFKDDIMYEVACEPAGTCNVDQRSFKAYLSRWMAATTKIVPFTHDIIMPLIQTSAAAAALACTGGDTGDMCGVQWTTGVFDGNLGIGEQMSALEVIQSNLIDQVAGPVSASTGGISSGDASGGLGSESTPSSYTGAINTGDRAGAGILTALVIISLLGGTWWMVG